MKKFFKTTFACTLGTLIAGMLLMIIFVVGLVGAITSTVANSNIAYTPQEKTVLQLDLSGSLTERYSEDPMQTLMSGGNEGQGLDLIRRAIKVASENDKVVGIYIDARGLSAMPASSEEIRRLLVEFKQNSGKWIYAYADNYTQNDYIIASVADSVIINPIGSVDIHGLGGLQMFYPKLFEKFGIEYQIFRVGTYKSAVEPFMCEKMSDANREQTMAYLNSIWGTFTDAVSASRGFTPEFFNSIADSITSLRPTREMLAYNLVDTTMYRPEFDAWLKTKVGVEEIGRAHV